MYFIFSKHSTHTFTLPIPNLKSYMFPAALSYGGSSSCSAYTLLYLENHVIHATLKVLDSSGGPQMPGQKSYFSLHILIKTHHYLMHYSPCMHPFSLQTPTHFTLCFYHLSTCLLFLFFTLLTCHSTSSCPSMMCLLSSLVAMVMDVVDIHVSKPPSKHQVQVSFSVIPFGE